MESIQYEGLLGIMSEINKKIDVIQAKILSAVKAVAGKN